eukprot:jgi/Bigna1/128239/aug1.6_g2947
MLLLLLFLSATCSRTTNPPTEFSAANPAKINNNSTAALHRDLIHLESMPEREIRLFQQLQNGRFQESTIISIHWLRVRIPKSAIIESFDGKIFRRRNVTLKAIRRYLSNVLELERDGLRIPLACKKSHKVRGDNQRSWKSSMLLAPEAPFAFSPQLCATNSDPFIPFVSTLSNAYPPIQGHAPHSQVLEGASDVSMFLALVDHRDWHSQITITSTKRSQHSVGANDRQGGEGNGGENGTAALVGGRARDNAGGSYRIVQKSFSEQSGDGFPLHRLRFRGKWPEKSSNLLQYVGKGVQHQLARDVWSAITARVPGQVTGLVEKDARKKILKELPKKVAKARNVGYLVNTLRVWKQVVKDLTKLLPKDMNIYLLDEITERLIPQLHRDLDYVLYHNISAALSRVIPVGTSLSLGLASREGRGPWSGCRNCPTSQERMYYTTYYATHYTDYYSSYYGQYYIKASENLNKAAAKEDKDEDLKSAWKTLEKELKKLK